MKKTAIVLASTLALLGNVAFAAAPAKKDVLFISFVDFYTTETLYPGYQSDDQDGVHITGPSFITTNLPESVNIVGNSYDSEGKPSLNFQTTGGQCDLNFQYGPNGQLSFVGGQAPFCRDMGWVVSNMTDMGDSSYFITITNADTKK